MEYARRCKTKKEDSEKFDTLHGFKGGSDKTLCGKELNEMWFIESGAGLYPEHITCSKCKREI